MEVGDDDEAVVIRVTMLKKGLEIARLQRLNILLEHDLSDCRDGEESFTVWILLVELISKGALESHEELSGDHLKKLCTLRICL